MEFTSSLKATLVEHYGDDISPVRAARVSIVGAESLEAGESEGLIKFLIRNRHASPFEHAGATFLVDVPIFVSREWMRHRTQSFNEVSGRYTELEPRFYIPNMKERPLKQVGKPGSYKFSPGSRVQKQTTGVYMEDTYSTAWDAYKDLLWEGVAKEVARMVLPVGIYTQFYATANLRNWLNFLSLRTADDALYEIREVAAIIETTLHNLFPTTLNAWDEYGRSSL